MKKIIFILLITLITSCNTDDEFTTQNEANKVVLLKVDYLTNEFEGGKELEFQAAENFTITSNYVSPADIGGIQLFYSELDQKIFQGTIIWSGTGARSYPESLNQPNDFATIDQNLELPNADVFEPVLYDQFAYYPDPIDYAGIWNAISSLEVVKRYRDSNPQGKIHLFLYTPSVALGSGPVMDWYIYIKN
ncbi:hypothetical protein [Kordia sp.]|uniref:hypothetical protein n=1 Tax=Kordia sp. TaxID=1965332 RepID=UPI003D6A41BE